LGKRARIIPFGHRLATSFLWNFGCQKRALWRAVIEIANPPHFWHIKADEETFHGYWQTPAGLRCAGAKPLNHHA
jgi:hypothetical protein